MRPVATLVGLGLAAWLVFFFRHAVFEGQTLFARDINMVWLPQVEVFVRSVASGSWPTWDPYRGFGQPLLADPRAEVFYPITWLNLILPPWAYYSLFVVSHLLLSGLGLYALARRHPMGRAGAFLAAAVWVGSGPLLSLASVWHHLAAAAWMPWVLLAAERTLAQPRLGSVLAWGAAIALQVLAGSPDFTALTLAAVALDVALVHVAWRRGGAGRNRAILGATTAAVAFGLGLAAAQWLPTLEVARRSGRWPLSYEDRVTWSLHPAGLLETLLPFRWSELPLVPPLVSALLESKEPWLHSIYLGAPAAALAVTAALLPSRRSRFLIALALLAPVIALGRHTPVYEFVTALLPPLRTVRYPVKAMLLASLGWSLLAGVGFDAWRGGGADPGARRAVRFGVATGLVLAAVGLAAAALLRYGGPRLPFLLLPAGDSEQLLSPAARQLAIAAVSCLAMAASRRAGPHAPALVMALVLADLMLAHRDLHPVAPRQLFSHRPEALRLIDGSPPPRVYVYDYSIGTRQQIQAGTHPGFRYRLARAPVGWPRAAALVLGVHMYLNPPTAARWSIFGSYDLDILGLSPRPVAELTDFLREVETRPEVHLRLLQMGSVTYALALHPQEWWEGLIPVGTVEGLFDEPIRVFAVPTPLPRSYVVDGVRVADGAEAFRLLADPGFQPSRELILSEGRAAAAGADFRGSSRILGYQPDRVRLEAELNGPGYVVLTDGWEAGWRAAIDGAPAPVLRANVAFRAVRVPAGRHVVEYSYRPRGLGAGLLVSATSVLAGVTLAVRAGRPQPQGRPAA